jgi:hypothetical protein
MPHWFKKLSKENRKNIITVGSGIFAGGLIVLAIILFGPRQKDDQEAKNQITGESAPPSSDIKTLPDQIPPTTTYAQRFDRLNQEKQECIKKALGEKLHASLMENPAYFISYDDEPKLKEVMKCYK